MTLLILAFVGGALTILSPCILPVLPFVFSRAGRPFATSTLPMLAGMALTFAAVASLASVAGGWVVHFNEFGRIAALVLLGVFGLSLLLPRLADTLTAPLVAFGNRLAARHADAAPASAARAIGGSLLLGVATGMLWAPCAGPILGIVLTGAALRGASVQSTLLLVAYAAGAATSLAIALGVGGRLFAAMRGSLGAAQGLRRGLGVGVLAGVVAIGFGADTGLLARLGGDKTSRIEQALIDALRSRNQLEASNNVGNTDGPGVLLAANDMRDGISDGPTDRTNYRSGLPVEGRMPALDGAVEWLNSPPLTREQLRGKPTLVYFWTYSCINCIRTLPYLRAWAEKYPGLQIVAVHTPEFAFEKKSENIRRALADFRIQFPVAVDSDYKIWRAFDNNYWPAAYFVDANGQIRHHQFGEGDYARSEQVIQALLKEAGNRNVPTDTVTPDAKGAQAAPDLRNIGSGETYLGYQQATDFEATGFGGRLLPDAPRDYQVGSPRLNHWGLKGNWTVNADNATVNRADGSVVMRFRARDLHLVLGPAADGKAVRFIVTIDGKAPGASHGADIDAAGNGAVTATRLYQLVRQAGDVGERTFEIRFLDPGAKAYVFTFG
ncbi:cytochrome c biogenesis protein CcdA [Cupriavidus plantarum]|uniref:redoxin domain-containing protein n=1 Tax=Cupriavidus plantarum TaxID=942865 RepID=UPI001B2147A3|nr:cytochrome c biogenesis protein CcdA [Cupriavidus plantarum]CAG2145735.1 Protein DipZ [Cupriavidus plantarum]SMR86709.1 Cytochrome c biogenesis protein CcdA [Cupriavidus plantarum]